MAIVSIALFGIGFLISLIFGIQLLILAFRTSVLWGLGSLFLPLVGLIFIIMHWAEAKKPFLYSLLAIPFFIAGAVLAPTGTPVVQ